MEQSVRVADRIFALLELVTYAQTPPSLSELSEKLGLSKSTVHRLLQSLLVWGYVEKKDDSTYTLGGKFIELAGHHINSLELQTEASPYLSMLYSQLELSVHLGVLEDYKLKYVTKLDRFPTTKNFARVGYETPAYCSSIGKCLLAALSGDDLSLYLKTRPFHRFTENTITDGQTLRGHLRTVRAQGYAMDLEEYQFGHRCCAVPIYDYRGNAIAAVGISGNTEQLSDDKLPGIIRELQQTAGQISVRMGYR